MASSGYKEVGDIVTLIRGTTYKGALVGKPGPALLGLGSIVPGGGFRTGDFKTYGGDCPEKLTLRPGDLYVSLKGATKDGEMIGSVAQVPPQVLSGRLTQDTVKLVINPNFEALRSYLHWLLRTPQYRSYCAGRATGSAVVGLSRDDFLSFCVPEFSAFRAAIVDLLDSIHDKIELNRRMNETLEAMAQAIFRDWFVDFGPTRRKLEGATDPVTIMGGLVTEPIRAQELAQLFPTTLGDNGLPEGWEASTLGALSTLMKRGLTPKYTDDGVVVINQKCIRNGSVSLGPARLHDGSKRSPGDRLLEHGDVLVNSTGVGTLGRVATFRRHGLTATADSHVTICRADIAKTSKLMFALAVERYQPDIEAMGHGSTGQTELSPHSLGALTLVVPDRAIQEAFDRQVSPLRALVDLNTDQSVSLASTRDLLLPKLMSGELRLGEAQELAEQVA